MDWRIRLMALVVAGQKIAFWKSCADSRIGTYGTLALIFVSLSKLTFLLSLPPGQIWRWLILAHTAARWTILPLCAWYLMRAPKARANW